MAKLKISAVLGAIALVAAGCAASNPPPDAAQPEHSVAAPASVDEGGLKVSGLDQLWETRRAKLTDFPIGTGDIIAVSIPGLPDFDNSHGGAQGVAGAGSGPGMGGEALDNWTVRVGSQGEINLPLLGRIHVAGLTEEQLREELKRRLLKYMYDPQVELFVKSYNSREVAVSGEVHAPGMYTINAPRETIRDLIVRAGGTTDSAASRIILTPAPPRGQNQSVASAPALRFSNRF